MEQTYSVADLQQLLSQRVGLDLSPIELVESLWLALQQGEPIIDDIPSVTSEPPASAPPPAPSEETATPTDQFPAPPSPDTPTPVLSEPPPTSKVDTDQPLPSVPINIPEAYALRNRREIAKSLRPLMCKVPSKTRLEFDEDATVFQIAEQQTWNPIMRPAPERWLELAIVIEVTNLLEVWKDSIQEFQHLLERHGAFRDVRTWQLHISPSGQPQLLLQTNMGLSRQPRSPKELLDVGGRRLVLLLSDCTSRAWRTGKIPDLLQLWSRSNPVSVVQLLPEKYWDRSALSWGCLVGLKSRVMGALSRDWQVTNLSSLQKSRLQGGLQVPVVVIRPEPFKIWAKAVATRSEQITTGIVLDVNSWATEVESTTESVGVLTAKQLVRRFRGTASAEAQELADMMAVLPVNWSVIRLIQKNLSSHATISKDTGALHLAEIFLSGLLKQLPMDAVHPKAQVQYDFVDGVREILQGTIPIFEAEDIGEEIAGAVFKQLPDHVQTRVNEDIKRRYGKSLGYFKAFLIPDLPWGEEPEAEILPFAHVTGAMLRRWGGEYAQLADDLQSGRLELPQNGSDEVDQDLRDSFLLDELTTTELGYTYPEILWPSDAVPSEPIALEVEVATPSRNVLEPQRKTVEVIVFETDPISHAFGDLALEPFEIQIATLEYESETWQVHYEPATAHRYLEPFDKTLNLELVAIPSGEFLMGSPESEAGRYKNEGPQHLVKISEFLMGRYPVTQAQWRFVARLPRINRHLNRNLSRFKGDLLPVERVSWNDAVEFCERLSQYTGRHYRLPSEAEWEYACRAGTTTPFHYGEMITTALANYNGIAYRQGPRGKRRGETTPISEFDYSNAFGLQDMHGNVWEWCHDHWHGSYKGAPTDGSAWLNANDNHSHILRGGSWDVGSRHCRSATRYGNNPDDRFDRVGFRVVLAPQ